jgi:molybdate transport system permease protein
VKSGSRLPIGVTVIGVLCVALFAIPLLALVVRTPWDRLPAILGSDVVVDAVRVSAVSSVAATALATVLGVPLAAVLARGRFRGRSVVRSVVTLPMVLPPVVGGAALLFAFGRRGVIGEAMYDATGLLLPFSLWGVIAANTFVALPFLVITVEGGLRNLDHRYETAASGLGAKPWTVFRRITLPLARPAIAAGMVLAWARSLGEFGATVTFAGNLPGRTQSLPLAVFVALESDRDAAIAISLLMVAISLTLLIALRDRWWQR